MVLGRGTGGFWKWSSRPAVAYFPRPTLRQVIIIMRKMRFLQVVLNHSQVDQDLLSQGVIDN